MSGSKFKNGLSVDECTECWGSGGFWVGDYDEEEWVCCDCCGGTGYDSNDYYCYMMEQEEEEEEEEEETMIDTNRYGVSTEPFRWYWIKHTESERGNTSTLATRLRNGWEYIDRKFAAYNQFVIEAKPATDFDLKKYKLNNPD